MIKGRFLLSGTIGALLVISNTANGISDPDFISEVKAARKKQKQLFDIKGFAKTPECLHKKKTTSMFKESLKCPHKEMQASLSKKTPKFLRKVSEVYSVCLDCEDHEILGCNCHPSCSECGWDETFECDMDHEEETGPGNCFACADGSEVVPLHDLNSGDTQVMGYVAIVPLVIMTVVRLTVNVMPTAAFVKNGRKMMEKKDMNVWFVKMVHIFGMIAGDISNL
eukprot:CAMPEP_0194345832 /NCGR_PEP_ID=MMETSP0171-20130528/105076_1 /TAXON_ID=218684 /ORGANISM="Corethron pennatum, Strain L29A3" /LENGTH=223 /DNA_ID=CAMNT_0039112863 /DNA_START=610 /DNA_END=1282 /DNA_ORIENTATION=-